MVIPEVLKGISLNIAKGEFISLVGPSGCGKSTLLRIIAGLEEQDTGHVLINDSIVDHIRPSDRNLSMVFQSYALYPHLNVFDNIAVPLRMRRLNTMQRLPILRWCIPGTRTKEKKIYEDVIHVSKQLEMEKATGEKTWPTVRRPETTSCCRPGNRSENLSRFLWMSHFLILTLPYVYICVQKLHNCTASLQTTFIYVTHDQGRSFNNVRPHCGHDEW